MFGYNTPTYNPQGYGYTPAQAYSQRPAYQQPIYQQPQPMMQDGALQARLVSGKEEAVAATVIPGTIFLFYDRARGTVYSKLIDPQTGIPEFREYVDAAPQAATQPPQYVTVEMFAQYQEAVERRLEALQGGKKTNAKAVTADE